MNAGLSKHSHLLVLVDFILCKAPTYRTLIRDLGAIVLKSPARENTQKETEKTPCSNNFHAVLSYCNIISKYVLASLTDVLLIF